MNRLLIALIMAIVIVLVLPYLYIPSKIRKTMLAMIPANQKAAQGFLLNDKQWGKWWPASSTSTRDSVAGTYYYNGHSFKAGKRYLSGVDLITDYHTDSLKNVWTIIPIGKDSVKILWEYELTTSNNPIKRMGQHRESRQIQIDMAAILQQLASFLSDEQNTYGIKVNQAMVTDTLLITAKATLNHDPDAASIYGLIHQLHQYASKSGATVTNPPMLNKRRVDSTHTEVMVALPINKELKSSGAIVFKRMVRGNLLTTEIQGGPGTVNNAIHQLENYLVDHRYESPAMHFESLVTDRIQQADTSKWVTRIYYPVF
ncbi:hypothetical protein [Paraflavitalea soli]|nr:hypothetical protein [Paraflavitalea soli]